MNLHNLFFQKKILKWFQTNARAFEWRKETDPYRILIAEIMLQRTRAEQVSPVYSEFIKEFQDLASITATDKKKVAKYFKKLGLFWRCNSVMTMAKYILEKYNGIIPVSRIKLLKIPSIGEYISNAILVFAFNQRITVVDSNVVRLVSRFFEFNNVRGETRRNKLFNEFCQKLVMDLEPSEIKNFNWGLIDFAHAICKPIPECSKCPLSGECMYFKAMFNKIKK